ncbi:3-hydroxyacyl-CoA dehydrogenase [Mycolicibacterium vaccae]|uniref:3-hydroxyacyl-CoA dehydrogenase n=1 Tax=Mycolicibacterium vaccae ATCC 25954 TaxID=1194972 RepID=K0VD44_MYCVA|nr:3-hydroxyacyl-CoA dehydrogenase [Mycolicibacterium vaccae]ANI38806.1 3-hydroxyacyl-CoA dehydrogenase [Mycolicibacterium vaccae 95051]EJZ08979.1 3-hydroxyacyl-CoA dehydrogenase [Mycolicibacterium vaccae ATCC 25954]
MTEVGDEVTVAILGGGSIGVAFAVLFAREGFEVAVYDSVDAALPRASSELGDRLAQCGARCAPRVRFTSDLASAVDGAGFVQECAPERLDLKQDLFRRAAALTSPSVPLVSSSSAIVPSALAAGLGPAVSARILVGHPGNPPYLLPVVEVVPSPETAEPIVQQALSLYRSAGMRPVRVRREVEGFVFNRLQGALLREAYCLVRDGVATVDDIDEVVRSGLGRRWSFMGPFETADLNTRGGIESHAAKMGPAYERMGAERGQHDPWTPELVAQVTAQRRAILDLADWEDRVRWRDRKLTGLAAALDADRAVEIG